MDRSTVIFIMLAVGACFLAYLLFTRQFKWLVNVAKNALLGCAGILGVNYLFAAAGISVMVGINAITAMVVGLLGLPGFMLLYAARMMVW